MQLQDLLVPVLAVRARDTAVVNGREERVLSVEIQNGDVTLQTRTGSAVYADDDLIAVVRAVNPLRVVEDPTALAEITSRGRVTDERGNDWSIAIAEYRDVAPRRRWVVRGERRLG